MTHPPPPLVGRAAWSWVQRMQVAAAFVIARLPGPWPGSFREEALTSLAWGVPDWSVEAGLCALARVAHAEAPAAVAVRDLFRELLSEVDPARPTCFDYGLVCNALFLPNLSQAERRRLLAQREALEQRAR